MMSRKEQDHAIKSLINHGLIKKIAKGVPAKRYFWIDENAVLALFGFQKNILDCPKGTNWNDQKGQTGHIYKEPYKEPYINKESVSVFQISNEKKERAPNVFLTDDDHQSLESKHDPTFVKQCYEYYSLWKESADPRTVAKHNSDYRRIKSWVIKAVKEDQLKDAELEARTKRLGSNFDNRPVAIANQMQKNEEEGRSFTKSKSLQLSQVRFEENLVQVKINNGWCPIGYNENGFIEQLKSALRKGGHI